MPGKRDHLKLVQNKNHPPAWKRALRFLGRLVLVSGLVLVLWQADAFFRIAQVQVQGAVELSVDEILKAAEISEGMNIFFLREAEAAARITAALPRVRQAEIKRILPDEVEITVQERQPAAYVMTADGLWLIDQLAVSFAYSSEPEADYPVISGIDGIMVIPGAPINCRERRAALQNLFSSLAAGDAPEIERIDLSDSYNLIVYTADGLEIWFGEGKDLDNKLELVKRSLPYIDPAAEERLDVRCGRRLVVSGRAVREEDEQEVTP